MIDAEEKAKVVRKLTHALHQAPDQPHNFANVPQQVIGSSGLHITDLAITIGDTTSILAKQLQAARRNAPPTYENLVDLASKKLNLGRHPERALAEVLGVPLRSVAEQKQSGRVPRGWFEKIHDLPDLDETRAYLDSETKRVVHILGQQGYSPEDIHNVFQRIRMTRAGVKQLASALHGTDGDVDANAVSRMREGLFGDRPNAEGRLKIWLATHARLEEADTARFEHMSADAATALLAVDVIGAMRMCHAVIPHMRRHGHGAIINFSSTYGNGINPENAINWVPVTYCAAKGAIRGLTASLARDLAPEIRVNALAPGPISGNWEQEWGVAPEHIEEAKAMNPMKRFGDPREIAETVLFLASDGAGYINGQVIHVEGGWVPAG